MKIIGWDIGIKNLSYCIFETDENNKDENKEYFKFSDNKYNLIEWDVINLVDEYNKFNNTEIDLNDLKNVKCSLDTKNDKKCNKKGHYVYWHKDNINDYKLCCKKHLITDNEDQYVISELDNIKCSLDNCNTKKVYVNKDNNYYGYCKKHFNEYVNDLDKVLKLVKVKSINNNNLTILSNILYSVLDNKKHLMDIEVVLFENQPVLKNPTMKSMQIFLYSYYVINSYRKNKVNELICYNACKKVEMEQFMEEIDLEQMNKEINKLKSKYSRMKKKAIYLVEYFFENNYTNENDINITKPKIDIFNNKKKRDDLADSFLMTLHYLEKKNILNMKKHSLKNKVSKNKLNNNKIV